MPTLTRNNAVVSASLKELQPPARLRPPFLGRKCNGILLLQCAAGALGLQRETYACLAARLRRGILDDHKPDRRDPLDTPYQLQGFSGKKVRSTSVLLLLKLPLSVHPRFFTLGESDHFSTEPAYHRSSVRPVNWLLVLFRLSKEASSWRRPPSCQEAGFRRTERSCNSRTRGRESR